MTGTTTRHGVSVWLATALIAALLCGAARAEEKTAQFQAYEQLAKQFDQLRKTGVKTMGPQELLTAAEGIIADLQDVVAASGGDPSAKSKSQRLLHKVYDFAAMAPESRQAYKDYLDTLETWQGKDYAVMAVRRAGDAALQRKKNAAKALEYYDLLLVKYPNHESKAHALYQAGLACIEGKAFDQAVQWFDALVEDEPASYYAPWGLRKKAYALAEMVPAEGDFSASLTVLDELRTKYPTPHWIGYAQYRKGYTLARQQKWLEAIAEYTKGINEHPSSAYSWMGQKHIAQIEKILQTDMLDELARRERQERERAEAEAKNKASPPTAAAKPPPTSPGPVSMAFPLDDDSFGEEAGR